MEFYLRDTRLFLQRSSVSIPNGMEFYGCSCIVSCWCYFVSIPNGMEFYGHLFTIIAPIELFQFPTGWNSTQCSTTPSTMPSVSIPNGMEFYRVLLKLFQFHWKFQFPTGWNSTKRRVKDLDSGESFNSQRDGILPKISYRLIYWF